MKTLPTHSLRLLLLLLRFNKLLVTHAKYVCDVNCKICKLFDHEATGCDPDNNVPCLTGWHCAQCKPGFDLRYDKCLAPCVSGKYRYGHNCEDCPENCVICNGPNPHECIQCATTHRFDDRKLCVKKCQDHYYPSFPIEEQTEQENRDVLNGCGKCHESCRSCLSWPVNACTECKPGYYLQKVMGPFELWKEQKTGMCVEIPPKGWYRKGVTDTRFYQCNRGCADCESWYKCFECKTGYFLEFGKCHLVAVEDTGTITAETYLGDAVNAEGAPDWNTISEQQLRKLSKNLKDEISQKSQTMSQNINKNLRSVPDHLKKTREQSSNLSYNYQNGTKIEL